MKQIWKFPLKRIDWQEIEMPKGATLRTLQVQREVPCIWMEVDPNAEMVKRVVATYGTGQNIYGQDNESYIGTYQEAGGALVWHLFLSKED